MLLYQVCLALKWLLQVTSWHGIVSLGRGRIDICRPKAHRTPGIGVAWHCGVKRDPQKGQTLIVIRDVVVRVTAE